MRAAKFLIPLLLTSSLIVSCGTDKDVQEHSKSKDQSKTTTIPSDNLKELAWLIGNWDNEGVDDIENSFKWDLNGHFILQTFILSSTDEDEEKPLTIKQIIGWDPVQNRIRSWIFDSDGGFGRSLWLKINDAWYASTDFVTPDGKKASATHIYKKIDDNTYTFSSENRDVNGDILPDIGPFKVVRKREKI
jgi:hypothetical protein